MPLKTYMAHVSVESIAPLIERHRGNIAAIARQLKVARVTVWDRIKESPELQAALVDARESMLDDAVTALNDKVLSGDIVALIFFLKTQGWRRGFAERKQLDIAVEQMDGHESGRDNDVMTLAKWQEQQKKNIAQVEATMALFDEVYEDDDDENTIDAEFTKTV